MRQILIVLVFEALLLCEGCVHAFTNEGSCVRAVLAAIEDIAIEDFGFLIGDSFSVKLKLRLKFPHNEVFSVASDNES